MKKTLALALALVMLCAFASAESDINTIAGRNAALGYPVVDTPVSVTIAVKPYKSAVDFKTEENYLCQYISRYSGLDVTWQLIDPATGVERITNMLNTGSMPDCILGRRFTNSDIVQYGVINGLFRPVEDLLQYMPVYSKILEETPAIRAEATANDGHMYGFPALNNIVSYANRIFINSQWLENVNLENPKTLDELKEVLIAFRDQDANGNGIVDDEIPWTGSWNEGFSERFLILAAYGFMLESSSDMALQYKGDDSVITYLPYTEEYKEYLLYMNDLWNEGLLDPDMFTQAELQVQANTTEGIAGIAAMSAPSGYDVAHELDWIAINPVVASDEYSPIYPGMSKVLTPGMMVLNADIEEEKAIALAKLADTMYSLAWYSMANFGPESDTEMDWNGWGHYYDEKTGTVAVEYTGNAKDMWTMMNTYLSIWEMPGYNTTGHVDMNLAFGRTYPDTAYGKVYKDGITYYPYEKSMNETYSEYYVEPFPSFYFEEKDLERINTLIVPLDDYVASMESKFITGEISIEDKFDEFTAKLENYGVNELVDIYTGYYEAYKAN